MNLEDVAGRMDGYSLGDVKLFHDAVVKASTIRHIQTNDEHTITDLDFQKAFESFKPFSQTSSKTESSTVEWISVGGMTKTKEMLLQTLKWPTMYPQIFQHCPLRLRSGILLYGYPGCGKTMLASAVAKECGLNFISVKGPELLNKYIGQSEKQVRDLFERARQCAPCCLFFDEFDSIAPTRGHDNSGVTDRVVNQLLTEMDGAQGLQGVYVLAATR
jgi:peroxin-1